MVSTVAFVSRLTARRVVADGYGYETVPQDRDAVDLFLDGESLSTQLDVAPYSLDEIAELDLARRWLKPGREVPVFNCLCGLPECGGIEADVSVAGDRVHWLLSRSGRRIQFDRQTLYDTLVAALHAS